jgi:hypothetical protein
MFPYRSTHALFTDGYLTGKLACQLLMEKGYYSRESMTSEREHYREYLDDIEWVNNMRRERAVGPDVEACAFRTFRQVIGLRRIVQERLALAQRRDFERRISKGLWSQSLGQDLGPT